MDDYESLSHTKRPRVASTSPVTWDIYQVRRTPAKWLGTIEATTADEAIEVAAKEFGIAGGAHLILTPLSCQDQDMFVAFAAFRPWHGLSCDISATIIRANSGKFLLLL